MCTRMCTRNHHVGNAHTCVACMQRELHTFRSRSSDGDRFAHDALDLPQCYLAKIDLACLSGLFKLSRSAGSDDGHIDAWLGQHPCNRQLRHAHTLLLRPTLQVLHHRPITLKALAPEDRALATPVIGRKCRLWRERPGEQSMR